ncbi:hypothetical protein CEXT_344891 [Caerostris extrusa]|uniref:Uncharacterized protein n=1 Tax=Caerostris extrusa TaxID=172846 RepID=A0AAV4UB83_CAEEX|nr:hypothetical protein CEXT_344891 [Caerostris extrusa]
MEKAGLRFGLICDSLLFLFEGHKSKGSCGRYLPPTVTENLVLDITRLPSRHLLENVELNITNNTTREEEGEHPQAQFPEDLFTQQQREAWCCCTPCLRTRLHVRRTGHRVRRVLCPSLGCHHHQA